MDSRPAGNRSILVAALLAASVLVVIVAALYSASSSQTNGPGGSPAQAADRIASDANLEEGPHAPAAVPTPSGSGVVASSANAGASGSQEQEAASRVTPSRFVAGHVTDPDGRPASACMVSSDAGEEHALNEMVTGPDGAFRLGPFRTKATELTATSPDDLYSVVAQVLVGAEDLQLRLTPFGLLTGVVFDGDGQPADPKEVILTHAGPDGQDLHWMDGRSRSSGGQFRIPFIKPGTYDVAVITADGLLGNQGAVPITSRRPTGPLKIQVVREGRMNLLYAGIADVGSCRIIKDGVVVQGPTLERGHPKVVPVPLGKLIVESAEGAGTRQEVVVTQDSVPDVMVP